MSSHNLDDNHLPCPTLSADKNTAGSDKVKLKVSPHHVEQLVNRKEPCKGWLVLQGNLGLGT